MIENWEEKQKETSGLEEMTHTPRGFDIMNFKDHGGNVCSLQKSSIATEDAIWFGANEIGLQEFVANVGWKDVVLEDTMTHHFVANNRMHLTRKMVKELLPYLQKFAKTGELI